MNRLFMLSILVFGLALALVGPRSITGGGTAHADFPGAQGALAFSQQCTTINAVQVNLGWTSSNQGQQWVDVSPFDNGFAWGTFSSVGPLSSGQSGLLWQGLQPNTLYFVRVNTLTPWGWVPTINVFMTMGCQHLLNVFNVEPSHDDFRHSCERANGRWDGAGKCVFIRFTFDFDRDRDHHDRDRDRDRDRDDHDKDRDHDRDDCDRGGNFFDGRDRDCDRDRDRDRDRDDRDRDDRDGDRDRDHRDGGNDGPNYCEGPMMDLERCRPPISTAGS